MEITLTTLAGFVVVLLVIFLMVRKIWRGARSRTASDSGHLDPDTTDQQKKSGCGTVALKIAYFILAIGIIILVWRLA